MSDNENNVASDLGMENNEDSAEIAFDKSNRLEFTSYYESQSIKEDVIRNIVHLRRVLTNFYKSHSSSKERIKLTVLDVGCGAGTQAMKWAEDGHDVIGVDVSERLIEIAIDRTRKAGLTIDFQIGTSSNLNVQSEHVDICLLPELLEHVVDWSKTLEECCRVLKPGGILYISTSNSMCPLQSEYSLPFYSWYPGFIKRICEKKAVTTHRHWVNYATYPAINWFTNPGLEKRLRGMGFKTYDRFDIMDLSEKPIWIIWLVRNVIMKFAIFRFLSYLFTRATIIVAVKNILEG